MHAVPNCLVKNDFQHPNPSACLASVFQASPTQPVFTLPPRERASALSAPPQRSCLCVE